MKKKILAYLLVCAAVLCFLPVRADSTELYETEISVTYAQTEARNMLNLVNTFRTEGSWYWESDGRHKTQVTADELAYDYGLEEIAMQRAMEIEYKESHTRPDGEHYLSVAASDGSYAMAECITAGSYPLAAYAFNSLLEENQNYAGQADRRDLLSTAYTAMGCACAVIGSTYYWVITLGSPTNVRQSDPLDGERSVLLSFASDQVKHAACNLRTDYYVQAGSSMTLPSIAMEVTLKEDTSYGAYHNQSFWITSGFTFTVTNSEKAVVEDGRILGIAEGVTVIQAELDPEVGGVLKATGALHVVEAKGNDMYRLYNPNSGEHFYTASASERDHLEAVGWRYEGIGWKAPVISNTAVYRLYNPNAGDHHYTTSLKEARNLTNVGWRYEGIGWYSDDGLSVPLYRQYNPNAVCGTHNYTKSYLEALTLVTVGWKNEGIGWYGM